MSERGPHYRIASDKSLINPALVLAKKLELNLIDQDEAEKQLKREEHRLREEKKHNLGIIKRSLDNTSRKIIQKAEKQERLGEDYSQSPHVKRSAAASSPPARLPSSAQLKRITSVTSKISPYKPKPLALKDPTDEEIVAASIKLSGATPQKVGFIRAKKASAAAASGEDEDLEGEIEEVSHPSSSESDSPSHTPSSRPAAASQSRGTKRKAPAERKKAVSAISSSPLEESDPSVSPPPSRSSAAAAAASQQPKKKQRAAPAQESDSEQ
jgi:hypothetical protein